MTRTKWIVQHQGNNNIAESVFAQLAREPRPVPSWIVVGAGTGGTSTTFARYVRYRQHPTRVAVVDPENSAYYPSWSTHNPDYTVTGPGSRIEGIGRPHAEPSFIPELVDEVLPVPDAASIAAMRYLHSRTGVRAGASTGINLSGALQLIRRMRDARIARSVVTLICDDGNRYLSGSVTVEWPRFVGACSNGHCNSG